jgi:hypothetical protein
MAQPNQLDLSSGQLTNSQRHNLDKVVYILSGTLPARRTDLPAVTFNWSTHRFPASVFPVSQVLFVSGDVDTGADTVDLTRTDLTLTGPWTLSAQGSPFPFPTNPAGLDAGGPSPPEVTGPWFLRLVTGPSDYGFYPTLADAQADTNQVNITSVGNGDPGFALLVSGVGSIGIIDWDPMIAPPQNVARDMTYTLGQTDSTPGIRIPVRNLAFRGSPSVLAAITDNVYAWEGARASLRVAYLKDGQGPEDVPDEDWTFLVKDGFLGSPEGVSMDGFSLPLYSFGSRRNQAISQYQTYVSPPAFVTSTIGAVTVTGQNGVRDIDHLGKVLPVIVGAPPGWIPAVNNSMPVRGFTVSGYSAGDTKLEAQLITSGGDLRWRGDSLGNFVVMVHYRTPTYTCQPSGELNPLGSGCTLDTSTNILTINLTSGLAADVPRGAYVVELADTSLVAADNQAWNGASVGLDLISGFVAWRLRDGSIVPVDTARWPWLWAGGGTEDVGLALELDGGTVGNPNPFAFFDPLGEVDVTQQPNFSSTQAAQLTNYASGGSAPIGESEQDMRDSDDTTFVSLTAPEQATLTFNDAPAPFANGDTTQSIINITSQNSLEVTNNAGTVTFATISGGAVTKQTRLVLSGAVDFNETIRFFGGIGGSGTGQVFEAWWEHTLSANVTQTRDDDVEIGGGPAVGEVLVPADIVFMVPSKRGQDVLRSVRDADGNWTDSPFREGGGAPTADRRAQPQQVVAGLTGLLLSQGLDTLNSGSYEAAQAFYDTTEIEWHFVIQEPLGTWSDLEAELAEQARAHLFYGPSGHEFVPAQDDGDLDLIAARQAVRLEGAPAANSTATGGALMVRTPTSEVVNTEEVQWQPSWLERGLFGQTTLVSSQDSVDAFGEQRRAGGNRRWWALAQPTYGTTSGVPPDVGDDIPGVVSGLAQFYADRHAYAQTRFSFETAWIAAGVDRGSIVSVSFPVTADGTQGRLVKAEVEEIVRSALNGERFRVTCRTVGNPQLGFSEIFTWAELFVVPATDLWTTYIPASGVGARWPDNWSAK